MTAYGGVLLLSKARCHQVDDTKGRDTLLPVDHEDGVPPPSLSCEKVVDFTESLDRAKLFVIPWSYVTHQALGDLCPQSTEVLSLLSSQVR